MRRNCAFALFKDTLQRANRLAVIPVIIPDVGGSASAISRMTSLIIPLTSGVSGMDVRCGRPGADTGPFLPNFCWLLASLC